MNSSQYLSLEASADALTKNQQNLQYVIEKYILPDVRTSSADELSSDDETIKDDDHDDKIIDAKASEFYKGINFSYDPYYCETDYCETDEEKKDIDELLTDYDQKVKRFKSMRPSFKNFIDSWPKENIQSPVGECWLSVYGYFNKDQGYGGYGVILRDSWARPIIAATYCTRKEPASQLFQVLNGLKTGLQLAVQHSLPFVEVVCNVDKAGNLLGPSNFQCFPFIDIHFKINGICKVCTECRVSIKKATLERLIPLLADLKELHQKVHEGLSFFKVFRHENEAAYHLAKMATLEADEVENYKVINPLDFPKALNKILYKDACYLGTRYSEEAFSLVN